MVDVLPEVEVRHVNPRRDQLPRKFDGFRWNQEERARDEPEAIDFRMVVEGSWRLHCRASALTMVDRCSWCKVTACSGTAPGLLVFGVVADGRASGRDRSTPMEGDRRSESGSRIRSNRKVGVIHVSICALEVADSATTPGCREREHH